MTDHLLKELRGNVMILTLNRPKQLNAWTGPMSTALYDTMLECENDPRVGCIVVTGAGRGFCAGANLIEGAGQSSFEDIDPGKALE